MKSIIVFTPVEIYRDCCINRNAIIASMIGEKIKEIIFKYGSNITFEIKKIKHIITNEEKPYTVINGFVGGWYLKEKDHKKPTYYVPWKINEYLEKVWFDYQINFELKG